MTTDWQLTRGLQNLRTQVNARFPRRDKASDGAVGDAAHQAETSGHNPDSTPGSAAAWQDGDSLSEVRAWDMDSDLAESGTTAQQVVDHVRRLPNVSSVLRYMIYNRKMYHSRDGFAPTDYTGASAHTEHIHFEGAWSQAADNNTTFDYRLDEINMPTVDEIVSGLLSANLGSSGPTVGAALQNGISSAARDKILAAVLGSSGPTVGVALQTGAYQNSVAALAKISDVQQAQSSLVLQVAELQSALSQLSAAVSALNTAGTPPTP